MNSYNPETYWTEVANRINTRDNGIFVAGDDEPYYRYKRACFLDQLKSIDFKNKKVLEVGCGPGGNLLEVANLGPLNLAGVDISDKMVSLARTNLPSSIEVSKSTAVALPFQDRSFDILFTVTVLQHNTDPIMFINLLHEMTRVSSGKIVLFERVNAVETGDELCLGRPIESFSTALKSKGFSLVGSKNLKIQVSYIMAGIIRKLFNKKNRSEGVPLSNLSIKLQNALLPLSSKLDKIFNLNSDLTMMEFERTEG